MIKQTELLEIKRCTKTGKFLKTDSFCYVALNINKIGIYQITNIINGKIYIGSTFENFKSRWFKHLQALRKKQHPNVYLQASYNKYGIDNFLFTINEEYDFDKTKEFIQKREQYYLDNYIEFGYDYNFHTIAKGGQVKKINIETSKKIIKEYLNTNCNREYLSLKYKIGKCSISKILNGNYFNQFYISKSDLKKVKNKSKLISKKARINRNKLDRKLTLKEAGKIKWLCSRSTLRKPIANYFKINTGTLSNIVAGKTYQEAKLIKAYELENKLGITEQRVKEKEISFVKWLYINNYKVSPKKLSKVLSISHNTIGAIRHALKNNLKQYSNYNPIKDKELLQKYEINK